MNGSSNVGILSVDIDNDLAVVSIESNVLRGESNFLADPSGNLFEINLGLVDTDFSEKNNLKESKI